MPRLLSGIGISTREARSFTATIIAAIAASTTAMMSHFTKFGRFSFVTSSVGFRSAEGAGVGQQFRRLRPGKLFHPRRALCCARAGVVSFRKAGKAGIGAVIPCDKTFRRDVGAETAVQHRRLALGTPRTPQIDAAGGQSETKSQFQNTKPSPSALPEGAVT